eukprot:123642-Hanusia_phi.AAC.1
MHELHWFLFFSFFAYWLSSDLEVTGELEEGRGEGEEGRCEWRRVEERKDRRRGERGEEKERRADAKGE